MSRWLDAFKTHAFHSSWDNLKIELDKVTIDDESVFSSVQELARLKKVTSYLDGMIEGIDPEIVPMATWDNFNNHAMPCLQQILEYNNNRNIGHIQNANNHADNLLSYIKPYMVVAENIGTTLQTAIRSYADTIEAYGESFRNKSSDLLVETKDINGQSQALFEQIKATDTLIKDFNNELLGGDAPTNSIKNKVDELVNDFERKHETIATYYNAILIGDEDTISTKKEITLARESILAEKKNIEVLLDTVEKHVDELSKFHHKIFGKLNESNVIEGGLKAELDQRTKQLKDFEGNQQIKYNALIEQIESLIPGATSAWLASAYHDMRISFDKPIIKVSWLFFVTISLLLIFSVFSSMNYTHVDGAFLPDMTVMDVKDWETISKNLVGRLPIYIPILWLALYASKRRSEYQRLQQEYAHKEAIAKSYDKYKKQIEDLDNKDPELQKLLITKAIDAIAYNASNTLDRKHGDKMPVQDLIEKVVGVALKKSKDS